MLSLTLCLLLSQLTGSSPVGNSAFGNSKSDSSADVGPFIQALHLVQQYGTPAAAQDARLKSTLAKALAHGDTITFDELGDFMTHERFRDMSGNKNVGQKNAGKNSLHQADQIDAAQIARALEVHMPASRSLLPDQLRTHADLLTTSFDLIDESHRVAGDKLAMWLSTNYQAGKPLSVIVVCTGNSRRSILGSSMGNLAATYYGLDDIRFYSGGTNPSAFNKRTIAALEDIGFDITATGDEAKRGEPKTPNPIFRVAWGAGLQAVEFSKHYADESNPHQDFAALMVCTEADEGCPVVQGAALRLSMPYLDPKAYDDSPFEAAKYAERRDDIGRLMLSVLCQVRRTLNQ